MKDYVKLSNYIYFCEIVYFRTVLKTKNNVEKNRQNYTFLTSLTKKIIVSSIS